MENIYIFSINIFTCSVEEIILHLAFGRRSVGRAIINYMVALNTSECSLWIYNLLSITKASIWSIPVPGTVLDILCAFS